MDTVRTKEAYQPTQSGEFEGVEYHFDPNRDLLMMESPLDIGGRGAWMRYWHGVYDLRIDASSREEGLKAMAELYDYFGDEPPYITLLDQFDPDNGTEFEVSALDRLLDKDALSQRMQAANHVAEIIFSSGSKEEDAESFKRLQIGPVEVRQTAPQTKQDAYTVSFCDWRAEESNLHPMFVVISRNIETLNDLREILSLSKQDVSMLTDLHDKLSESFDNLSPRFLVSDTQ